MRRALYDMAALVGRLALGVVFIAHGWAKYKRGVDATAQGFAEWNIPVPRISAWFAIAAELGGGILLVLGLLTMLAGAALFVLMAGALMFVHVGHGILLANGGFELVLALGAVALLLAVAGPGRISLDYVLFGRRREAKSVPSVAQPA
ncbi:DoxX family protein [Acrocarpospora macrocephala]|uniref:Membrane protein n=1 Tax=Acrocarpospora macrocephala TaxID=150177 RepID=A0A5M3WV61_9ACTN|nr:DoxX family protein [Acrocarpospora macrocephala]GES12774.1 membrane protein [Acrocarpospora macrocephala]